MGSDLRPIPGGPRTAESTFTRQLRFEIADDEGRVLLKSYGVAFTMGIAWLLMVYLWKPTARPELVPKNADPIEVVIDLPPVPPETVAPPTPATATPQPAPAPGPTTRPPGRQGPTGQPRPGPSGSRTEQNRTGAIGEAFGTGSGSGTGGVTGDVSNVLRGVDVNAGSGGTGGGLGGSGGGGTGGKTVLGYGQGGQGSRTPGRGGIGGGSGTGGGGGGGIGGVGGGGGVARAAVRVTAPRVIAAPSIGGPGRDVSDLGTFVRSRESQLRYCYTERGLKQNPNLAGTITVAITLTGAGNVTAADVTSRTWSGAGAADAESCIRSRIRSWKFPSDSRGGGTYAFPFNFTT